MDILLIVLIAVFSLYACYLYLMVITYTKEGTRKYLWFGTWLFSSKDLTTEGAAYRRKLLWVMLLYVVIVFPLFHYISN